MRDFTSLAGKHRSWTELNQTAVSQAKRSGQKTSPSIKPQES